MRDKPLQRGHRPQLPSITFQFIISLLGGKKTHTNAHRRCLFHRKKDVISSWELRRGHESQCCLFDPSLPLFRVKAVRQWLNRQSSGDQSHPRPKHTAKVMREVKEKKINSMANTAEDIWLWSAEPRRQSMGADSRVAGAALFPCQKEIHSTRKLHVQVFTSASTSASASGSALPPPSPPPAEICPVITLTP